MTPEQVVGLSRQTIEAAFWVAMPILLSAMAVGLLINIGQVLTSIQDTTVSTVPRLTAVGIIIFLLTPWMLHHLVAWFIVVFVVFHLYIALYDAWLYKNGLVAFTKLLFGDFRLYTQ
jgi:flagellar biosynthetic protein FliQ